MNRQRNVAEIKRLLREKKETFPKITRFLVSKGITQEIAEKITFEYMQSSQAMGALPHIIASYLKTSAPPTFSEPTFIALVGPTGVGKSTTILKLAAHYREKKVAILSLDHTKRSIFEEITKKWNIELFHSLEELKPGFDLTLIDTEGCNYYQESRVDSLGDLLAAIPQTEIHLTLSASTKEVDLYGAIHQFSPLQPQNLIFTKLDETLTLGTLVNICAKSELPIRFITHGYPLPGELEEAKSAQIVKKMLADLNSSSFQRLRSL